MGQKGIITPSHEPLSIHQVLMDCAIRKIIGLSGNDVTYAAPRIRYIARIARDDVEVEMKDCLTSRVSLVESHIESVRPEPFRDD